MANLPRRLYKWQAKFNTERVKGNLDEMREQMWTNYQTAMAQLCSMEEQVKTVLNTARVHSILYVPYLDFARQVYKLRRQQMSGDSYSLAVDVLLKKWAERGLNPDVLALIRTEVFDVAQPTPWRAHCRAGIPVAAVPDAESASESGT